MTIATRLLHSCAPLVGSLALVLPSPALQADLMSVDCSQTLPILCYGEHIDCDLSTPIDVDTFRFIGNPGDPVRVLIRSSTTMDPKLQILDPTGTPLPVTFSSGSIEGMSSSWCNGGCTLVHEVTLPLKGTYTLRVDDKFLDHSGPYTLTLERILPPYPIPAVLYNGSLNVDIDYLGDIDFVEFEGNALDQISLNVQSTTSTDPWIDIYDPAGAMIASANCNGGCSLSVPLTLQMTGTYRAVIHDWFHDQTGTFLVALNCVFSPSVNGTCADPAPNGPLGGNYCMTNPNSTGVSATIAAVGDDSLTGNGLYLMASDAPSNMAGFFLVGPNQGFIPLFSGSAGNLCIGAPVGRFPLSGTCSFGNAHQFLDVPNLPQGFVIQPGDTYNFQMWFRDNDGGPTSNTTNAVSISFP